MRYRRRIDSNSNLGVILRKEGFAFFGIDYPIAGNQKFYLFGKDGLPMGLDPEDIETFELKNRNRAIEFPERAIGWTNNRPPMPREYIRYFRELPDVTKEYRLKEDLEYSLKILLRLGIKLEKFN